MNFVPICNRKDAQENVVMDIPVDQSKERIVFLNGEVTDPIK